MNFRGPIVRVVRWLERLSNVAESRRKVMSPRLPRKTLYVSPAVKGTFLESGKDKAAKGEGRALPVISSAQNTVGL